MQSVNLTFEHYAEQAKQDIKLANNKFLARKKPVDTSKGIAHHKYFYLFLIGSLIGTIYEEILMYFLFGVWTLRGGVFWLKLNPLYGFGVIAFVFILSKFKKWYHQITYGAIIGGTVEYFAHFFQEMFVGGVSWDYSNKITNIDGRTTVLYALVWGIMGFLLVRYLYPLIVKALTLVPYQIGEYITTGLKILVFSVITISFGAVIRCNFYTKGYKPLTFVGELFDKYFPLSYIKKYYTNLRF